MSEPAAPAPPDAPAAAPPGAAPVAAGGPPVGPLAGLVPPWRPPTVEALGRRWPRAARAERAFWAASAVGALVVLLLAAWLRPDGRGVGTHQQLGLPPCGFVDVLGVPCPSCGFTTTFALAAHLRPVDAVKNQPFGFVLFLGAVACVPVSALAAWRGVSLLDATAHWPWGKILVGLLTGWVLGWGYKWWSML